MSGAFGKGIARLCGVLAAPTARELRRLLALALRETPTAEIRLDWLKSDAERRIRCLSGRLTADMSEAGNASKCARNPIAETDPASRTGTQTQTTRGIGCNGYAIKRLTR